MKELLQSLILEAEKHTQFFDVFKAIRDEVKRDPEEADRIAAEAIAPVRYGFLRKQFHVERSGCLRRVIKQTKTCSCEHSAQYHYAHLRAKGVSDHCYMLVHRETGAVYYLAQPYHLTMDNLKEAIEQLTSLGLTMEFNPKWSFHFPGLTHAVLIRKDDGDKDFWMSLC